MSEPARVLQLVPDSGEMVACLSCHEKDILIEQLQGELLGKSGAIGKLKREVARVRGLEPESAEVRQVLAYWRDTLHTLVHHGRGQKAKIVPESERWGKVKARLKEGYTVDDLRTAVDGALISDFHRENGYLDAKTIFRDSATVEAHRDRAIDPASGKLYALGSLPVEIVNHPWREEHLLSRCDYCECLSMFHSKPDPFRDYCRPCLSCEDCEDFCDDDHRADEWMADRERRLRHDRVRARAS